LVHAGDLLALLHGALDGVAALAFQEELDALPPAEAALGACDSRHGWWSVLHGPGGFRGRLALAAFARCGLRYTRRRFRGLHPLCGSGVTSSIARTFSPRAWRLRMAGSRPVPGPFTRT